MTFTSTRERRAFLSNVTAHVSLFIVGPPRTAPSDEDVWARHTLYLCGDWSGVEVVSVYAIGNGNNGTDHWRSSNATNFLGADRVRVSPIQFDHRRNAYAFDILLRLGSTNSDDICACFRFLRRSKHGAKRYGVFAAAFKCPDTPTLT